MSITEYRLFFIDEKGAIQARHEFCAADDADASFLAAFLCDACADSSLGYELWSYARLVVSTLTSIGTASNVPTPDEIGAEKQHRILDLEDAFHRSHWRLSRSAKLLAAMGELRQLCDSTEKR